MLLNDMGKGPAAIFKQINQHLSVNYGFKISEETSGADLTVIMEQIDSEITELKYKGETAHSSRDISQRLLILEGLKYLKESASFKSSKLDTVINNLVDYVVDTFEISGMEQIDFDKAVGRAMDEYRSSRYRFPDEFIEQRVRQAAAAKVQTDTDVDIVAEDDFGTADEDAEMDGVSVSEDDMQVPMERSPDGTIVPCDTRHINNFGNKGLKMNEHAHLVKHLRKLLETEVSQAEVMMAAKGFAQELQEMVEKIGRLQNEDLPPVTDQMRETYDMESASAFQTKIYGALQSVMDALYTAKGQVDDAVGNMANTGRVEASVDMDKGVDGLPDDNEMPDDLDNISDTDGDADDAEMAPELGDLGDDFGAEDSDSPLGRDKKMESVKLQHKILEMRKLVNKARRLKESSAK